MGVVYYFSFISQVVVFIMSALGGFLFQSIG